MVQLRNLTTIHGERTQLRKEVARLTSENKEQSNEIKAVKTATNSYQDELERLKNQVRFLEEQALKDTLTAEIGKQTRFRYPERRQQQMGRDIGALGYECIRYGDCAAHRGRPVVDALLCQISFSTDREVYKYFYGIMPKFMVEMKDQLRSSTTYQRSRIQARLRKTRSANYVRTLRSQELSIYQQIIILHRHRQRNVWHQCCSLTAETNQGPWISTPM